MDELDNSGSPEASATTTRLAPADRDEAMLSTAEVAECRCPDFCERDHDLD